MTLDPDLVKRIVLEVLERLERSPRKALVLLSGGTIGAEQSIKAIGELKSQGWQLKMVLTPGAERALDLKKIHSLLADVPVLTEATGWPPIPLLQAHDLILVPILTINTASKVSLGVADNLVTTLLLEGLLMGKSIVAAKDACDIDHPQRIAMGMDRGTAIFKQRLRDNIANLVNYGVHLVPATELVAVANRMVGTEEKLKDMPKPDQLPVKSGINFKGKILSRGDLVDLQDRKITINRATIVTPLARDIARESGISIVIQEN